MKIRQDKSFTDRRKRNDEALKKAMRYFENDLRQEYVQLRRDAQQGELK